jgi:hypothetical protein
MDLDRRLARRDFIAVAIVVLVMLGGAIGGPVLGLSSDTGVTVAYDVLMCVVLGAVIAKMAPRASARR